MSMGAPNLPFRTPCTRFADAESRILEYSRKALSQHLLFADKDSIVASASSSTPQAACMMQLATVLAICLSIENIVHITSYHSSLLNFVSYQEHARISCSSRLRLR
jgi:hypothetical protein